MRIMAGLIALFVASKVSAADVVLPGRETVFQALPNAGYAEAPEQIPATVIDEGILQNVPYVSYRVGENRELNVYGDLTAPPPACIDIGLYAPLLDLKEERLRCLTLIHRLVPQIDLQGVNLTRGKSMRGGVVIEVTPSTDPDAYGAWWVSVYSLPLVHAAAGTSANISEITVSEDDAEKSGMWTKQQQHRVRRTKSEDSSSEGRAGKKDKPSRQYYVRDYTRANGTQVHSYKRN